MTEQNKPVAWLVLSKSRDGSLSLEYAAAWEEAAHEHIDDAITEHGIEEAGAWSVRPAYLAPSPAREWVGLTEQEIAEIVQEAARGAATRRDGTTSQRIARAIEQLLRSKNEQA